MKPRPTTGSFLTINPYFVAEQATRAASGKVALVPGTSAKNHDLSVRVKAVAGKEDRGRPGPAGEGRPG